MSRGQTTAVIAVLAMFPATASAAPTPKATASGAGWYVHLGHSPDEAKAKRLADETPGSVVLETAAYAYLEGRSFIVALGPFRTSKLARKRAQAHGDNARPFHTGPARPVSARPDDDDPYLSSCGAILNNLHRVASRLTSRAIPLTSPPTYATEHSNHPSCDEPPDTAQLLSGQLEPPDGFHVGRLGGRPALVHLDGPGGSGRYWKVTVVVRNGDEHAGTCMDTSTVAWRNIYKFGDAIGSWMPISADGDLVFWMSLQGGAGGTNATYLLVPLVYSLTDSGWVLREDRTNDQLRRMARIYADAAASKDARWTGKLHRAAADAFRSYADGELCPER